jgi:hypothetical protein
VRNASRHLEVGAAMLDLRDVGHHVLRRALERTGALPATGSARTSAAISDLRMRGPFMASDLFVLLWRRAAAVAPRMVHGLSSVPAVAATVFPD